MSNANVGRADALEAFARFDTEGVGKADPDIIKDGVAHLYEEVSNGELSYCTKVMQACAQLPGKLDCGQPLAYLGLVSPKLGNCTVHHTLATENGLTQFFQQWPIRGYLDSERQPMTSRILPAAKYFRLVPPWQPQLKWTTNTNRNLFQLNDFISDLKPPRCPIQQQRDGAAQPAQRSCCSVNSTCYTLHLL